MNKDTKITSIRNHFEGLLFNLNNFDKTIKAFGTEQTIEELNHLKEILNKQIDIYINTEIKKEPEPKHEIAIFEHFERTQTPTFPTEPQNEQLTIL